MDEKLQASIDKLKKKIEKNNPEFVESADSMTTDELKKQVMICEKHIYDTELAMENDEKLNAAREIIKEYSAPYRETKMAQTSKIKYMMYLLQERGEA